AGPKRGEGGGWGRWRAGEGASAASSGRSRGKDQADHHWRLRIGRMPWRQDRLGRRAQSIRFRIESLRRLRKLVVLPSEVDITERQWAVIEPQLASASVRLASRVRRASDALLPRAGERRARRELHAVLAHIALHTPPPLTS